MRYTSLLILAVMAGCSGAMRAADCVAQTDPDEVRAAFELVQLIIRALITVIVHFV